VSTAQLVAQLGACDRCHAPSKYQVVLPSGGTLLFCGHHAYQHTDALLEAGAILPMATAGRVIR
jgi:hypothetical protein